MKALIIGAAGFVGAYLADHLHTCKWSVSVTKLPHEQLLIPEAEVLELDILNPAQLQSTLEAVRPDVVFHLAAQSSVALSWKNPTLTVDVNIKGTVNLLETARTLSYKPRLLLVGSGEEYGRIKAEETPVGEETLLRPGNIYAATKACQNMLGAIYAEAYGLDIMMVRAFNHIGPGQAPLFVVADFCKQVAEIEAGRREPCINVGNLKAKRDFTDVRDIVRAYELLTRQGRAGELYNVGSGNAISIEDVLNRILALSRVPIAVKVDKNRLRPVDVPIIEANIGKLQAVTGWQRQYTLQETLEDTLNYWRKSILQESEVCKL